MPQAPQSSKPVLIRKRLSELKHRLKQVAHAWTVDDYEAFLDFYVRILPEILKAERCTIYIIEMSTDTICSMFGTGIQKKQIQPPRKGSIAGEVISTGKGMINNDLNASEGYHTQMDAKTGFVTRNSACYPIKSLTGHGVTGAVQILNKKDGPFTPQDMALLETVADYLSISIESIILNQEILRISNQLNKEYERFDRGYLRIICASNKDLKTEITRGNFREDLFFRLFSVEIRLPALREKKGDIVPLSMSFLEDISNLFNKKLPDFLRRS
jgi:transcriptional regulator with GAF, ATPase, and Fis domain